MRSPMRLDSNDMANGCPNGIQLGFKRRVCMNQVVEQEQSCLPSAKKFCSASEAMEATRLMSTEAAFKPRPEAHRCFNGESPEIRKSSMPKLLIDKNYSSAVANDSCQLRKIATSEIPMNMSVFGMDSSQSNDVAQNVGPDLSVSMVQDFWASVEDAHTHNIGTVKAVTPVPVYSYHGGLSGVKLDGKSSFNVAESSSQWQAEKMTDAMDCGNEVSVDNHVSAESFRQSSVVPEAVFGAKYGSELVPADPYPGHCRPFGGIQYRQRCAMYPYTVDF